MGNILSTLGNECCCIYCKCCRRCCKDRCLTEEEKVQIIYDKIRITEEIWDAQV